MNTKIAPSGTDIQNTLQKIPDPYLGIGFTAFSAFQGFNWGDTVGSNESPASQVSPVSQASQVSIEPQKSNQSHEPQVSNTLQLNFKFNYPLSSTGTLFSEALCNIFKDIYPTLEIKLNNTWKVQRHVIQKNLKPIKNVKNTIAVASGKGGVGKSTTAVNLALALQVEGAKVGIIDADIYGPSQPRMLGIQERPEVRDNKRILPVISHGLQTMSMGYLVGNDAPMVWRGPMASSAVQQLTLETEWIDLDYLIIDLPPGTGDIQLTLVQKIPLTGVVIVSTPQEVALQDAKKALNMFRKLDIPILGMVENMSLHICSECGHADAIFGLAGGLAMAKEYEIPFLGQLPIDRRIRERSDEGLPIIIAEPEGNIARLYRDIARTMAAQLSLQPRDYHAGISPLVVKN